MRLFLSQAHHRHRSTVETGWPTRPARPAMNNPQAGRPCSGCGGPEPKRRRSAIDCAACWSSPAYCLPGCPALRHRLGTPFQRPLVGDALLCDPCADWQRMHGHLPDRDQAISAHAICGWLACPIRMEHPGLSVTRIQGIGLFAAPGGVQRICLVHACNTHTRVHGHACIHASRLGTVHASPHARAPTPGDEDGNGFSRHNRRSTRMAPAPAARH